MTDGTPGTESNAVDPPTGATTPNLFLRLFRGDVSLPVTYWIYGALIGVGFRIVQTAIELNYMDLLLTEGGELEIAVFNWFSVGYSLFMFVAIWRSAGKYKGNRGWAALARFMVVIGALATAGNLIASSKQTDQALREQFALLNQSLPTMFDDYTRIDRVSLQGRDIHYDYTLVRWAVAELDVESLVAVMTAKAKTDTCEDADTRLYLDDGRNIVYMYRDKQSDPVAKIVVTSADCL